jgi:hypothetical protein
LHSTSNTRAYREHIPGVTRMSDIFEAFVGAAALEFGRTASADRDSR